MKLLVKKGKTSKIVHIFVQDSSQTTGAGLTGLTSASSGLIAYYIRPGDSSPTAISLTTETIGTWTSGGFGEVDATHMPGVYELGLPNAVLATGADQAVVMLSGATNMAPVLLEIQLTDFDPQDGIRLGLTALPSAAVNSGANSFNLDAAGNLAALLPTHTGTAQAGTLTTLTLDTGASNIDGYYIGHTILWTSGTNQNVLRNITAYVGLTRVATFGPALPAAADSTPTFTVIGVPPTTLADGVSHGGVLGSGTATLALSQVQVVAGSGDAVVFTSSSAGGCGLKLTGSSGQPGLKATGGSNAHGIVAQGTGSGAGVSATGGTTGAGGAFQAGSGSGQYGLGAFGDGVGHGLTATGGSTGNGATFTSGGTGGNGVVMQGGNGSGGLGCLMQSDPSSTAIGLKVLGGALLTSRSGSNLAGLHCDGDTSAAGILATGDGGGPGIQAQGDVGQPGLLCLGGTSAGGHGAQFTAGTGSNGIGFTVTGDGTGAGLKATGGSTGHGIDAESGASGGNGLRALANSGNAAGLFCQGGPGSGAGLVALCGGGNGAGFYAAGQGTQGGIIAVGGATGPGFTIVGGGTSGVGISVTTTSGDGIQISPTAGHGFNITANGTGKNALQAVGGSGGNAVNFLGPLKGQILSNLEFLMVDSAGNPLTGLTVSPTVSKDGGAFAATAASVTEVGNGIYVISPTTADMGFNLGTFRFSATGARDTDITMQTVL